MSEVGANALINLIDLKTYLGIKTNDDDELLEDICNRATSVFEMFCNRKFKYCSAAGVAQEITEYHNGVGQQIFLNYYPIISVTSIHDDSDRVFGASTLVAATDYIVHSDVGIIEMEVSEFMGGSRGTKVVYKGGYQTDVPYDIVNAVMEIGGLLFKERDHLGFQSKQFSDGSVALFSDKLSQWTRAVIDRYSKPIIKE